MSSEQVRHDFFTTVPRKLRVVHIHYMFNSDNFNVQTGKDGLGKVLLSIMLFLNNVPPISHNSLPRTPLPSYNIHHLRLWASEDVQ